MKCQRYHVKAWQSFGTFFIVRVKAYRIIRSILWGTTRFMEWNRNGTVPFFVARKETKRMRSRHMVSAECTSRKSISCKAAAWAKPKDFRDECIRVPVIRISGWINKNLRKGEKRKVE
ncbi:MAG: hypothetical protein BHW48_08735 [Roseburia sp. CAG:10041_57]|nr:MAG: hypothetical protein BHW48_08735 [Roseburia sp. CAG:10041_57]